MAVRSETPFDKLVQTDRQLTGVAYTLVIGRLLTGWFFLQAGINNAITEPKAFAAGAEGLIGAGAASGIPGFKSFFQFIVNTPWMLDLMVVVNAWGVLFVGIALLAGVFFRAAALGGTTMMVFYWAAQFPFEQSHILNYNIFIGFTLVVLGVLGAGRLYGLDGYIEERLPEKYSAARYFLG